jgi:opacity protein-like surface antigen
MKMKKVSLLAILATVGASAAATAQAPVAASANCPKAFQGFHVGGNIGYGVGKGTQKLHRRVSSPRGVFTDSIHNNLGFSGVDGGVGVGYTHRLCNWALGIAFDANWASTSGKVSRRETTAIPGGFNGTDTITGKASLRNSLQLYGRAGYVLANMVMPFVGLGWDNSSWKHKVNFNGLQGSKSKRLNSLLWKVGVDFLATKHVVVGFEYTGTGAGKQSHTFATGNTTGKASFKPQYNKFALTAKLVY